MLPASMLIILLNVVRTVSGGKFHIYLTIPSLSHLLFRAIFSAQTMVANLGFTLTPDSMISFNDAPAPLLIMSALALAGHTFYPILLRFIIWSASRVFPKQSSLQEPLHFLLNHPRRCYTLLFPSGPTWALLAILTLLNVADVLFIILLDLDNPTVTVLPGWQRFCAAVFQAVSSRHTGTATFNLANVNPAVQLALLVMMYVSVYPISIVVRSSNTYEERSLGIYEDEQQPDEEDGGSYFVTHLRNQLSFDLWYICLGLFCITIAEHKKIMNGNDIVSTIPTSTWSTSLTNNRHSQCGPFCSRVCQHSKCDPPERFAALTVP